MTVLGLMQPYLFPYIGYFQLIDSVDVFVVFDTLSFRKSGWINRNRLKIGSESKYFTVPVKKWRLGQPINCVLVCEDEYRRWRKGFFHSIQLNYCKSPYYSDVTHLLHTVFPEEGGLSISKLATRSLVQTTAYLGIETEIIATPDQYDNLEMERQDRIIDTCRKVNAQTYINAIGGETLYSKEVFMKEGIELFFVSTRFTEYPQQQNGDFLPGLSIIDVLMNNSVNETRELLTHYTLI